MDRTAKAMMRVVTMAPRKTMDVIIRVGSAIFYPVNTAAFE